jgi:hypothetical protein
MSEPNFVTREELNGKLDKMPSRWEVRFLILAGFIGAQLIPAREAAQAALFLFT